MIKQFLGRLPRKPTPKPSSDDPVVPTGPPPPASAMASELPSLRDVAAEEQPSLFLKKLSLCHVVFDLSDPASDLHAKELKRRSLLDLADFVSSTPSKLPEALIQHSISAIAANLFRALPPPADPSAGPDDDDDPPADPSWPHLQLVYDLLLRLVASPETDPNVAKRHLDRRFLLRLLDLFDSPDRRERERLKTVLHRVYRRFTAHRAFVRRSVGDILCRFVLETGRHNGVAELLEVLGSIINGFALPLKEEHKLFLVRTLLPLHKPGCLEAYHQQLSMCVMQFVEKDVKLADTVVRGLLKYWPVTNSLKEVMFLGEMEEVLEAMQLAEFQKCMVPLSQRIARCLNSSHFQVAERALFLWNNDHVRTLIIQNRKGILPIIFPALERNTRGHWNQTVRSLTLNVRKIFLDADQELVEECSLRFQEDEEMDEEVRTKREMLWKRLEDVAVSRAAVVNETLLVSRAISSLGLASSASSQAVVSS